jgi:hypothetical protein
MLRPLLAVFLLRLGLLGTMPEPELPPPLRISSAAGM